MRKSLLLLIAAMLLPVISMAQNMAISKAARTNQTKTETRLLVSPDVLNALSTTPATSHSLAAWVNISELPYTGYTTESGTRHGIIMGYGGTDHSNDNGLWNVAISSEGKLAIPGGWGVNGMGLTSGAICDFTLGQWAYIVTVVDIENMQFRVYLDGEQVCNQTITTAPNWFTNETPHIYFAGFNFNGALDEVQIYNKALTDEEVAEAKINPNKVSGLAAYYTLDEAVSTNQFENKASGVTAANAEWQTATFQQLWSNGLVYKSTTSTVAPEMTDGRELARDINITIPESVDGGTIEVTVNGESKTAGTHTIKTTDAVIVNATPADGYELVKILAGEQEITAGATIYLTEDTEISAVFSNITMALTVVNEQNLVYTITKADGSEIANISAIAPGTALRLVVTVPESIVLNSVKLGEETLTKAATSYTYSFTMPEENATLTIDARTKAQYTVTINQPQGGTVSVATPTGAIASGDQVYEGTTLTLTATPEAGHLFVNYLVNDATYTGNTVVANADITISAEFEEGLEYCTVTGTASNTSRYISNITIADNQGNTATIEGVSTTGSGTTMAGASNRAIYYDHTDNIFTAAPGATITVTPNGGCNWMMNYLYVDFGRDGTFDVDQSNTGVNGDLVSHTGYSLTMKGDNSDTADPTAWSDGTTISDWGNIMNKAMPSFTLPADMKPGNYRVRLKVDWNNTNPCGRTSSTLYGGQKGNYINNNSGMMIDFTLCVKLDILDTPRTVTVASANDELGTVAIIDPATEELSVSTDQKNVTVAATAAENAAFMNWTDENGDVVSAEATYTYEGENDATFTANFGHSVTISPVQYGSLAVTTGETTIASGDIFVPGTEITVTATPAGGKELKEITINGTPVEDTDNVYTFTLNTNTVIAAEFQDVQYKLTIATEGNGTVTVSSDELDDNEAPVGTTYTDGDNIPYGAELLIHMVPRENGDQHETITNVIITNGIYTSQLNLEDGEQVWAPAYNEYAGLTDLSTALLQCPDYEDDSLTGVQGNVNVSVTFSNEFAAISDIIFDAENGPVEYYNLQGVRVAAENLTPGFYIARQGSKATKILIRK